ncbi:response regulator [Fundidesulfovibrio agrisoli]|uniref:response regulator n=1 Tax=Fundidesulfovibrio agrisoli TaxID=2922717 RepID=UPI001FAC7588|nr:response regulator [Fundidesulfovibrio agrisoli]
MATAASTTFTVILADRNPHIRELLAREFNREGYAVKGCALGREAVDLVSAGSDLLVMDSELPDMDPLSVIRLVRRARPGFPVAVLAHSRDEAGECLGEPRVLFVPKGEDPALVVDAVRGGMEKGFSGL